MGASVKFEGITDELRRILNANMDHAPARRRAREAFKDLQLNIDHILFKVVLWICLFMFLLVRLFIFSLELEELQNS